MPSDTRRLSIPAILLALVIAFLGWTFAEGGRRVLDKWDVISFDYALCGVLWLAAGATMSVAALWAIVSRRRAVLRIASVATVVAGATTVVGLLTYIIPCSGPS